MKSYDQFLEDLAARESGGDYKAINKRTRYLGKYQMGEDALIWTGKENVKSKSDFLNNPVAQEKAIREYMEIQWKYLVNDNVDRYVGQTKYGVSLTVSAVLAGAHLVGWSQVRPFITRGFVSSDKSGTKIIEYMKKFFDYETPFELRKKLTGIKRDKVTKKTVEYQVDGIDWVLKPKAIQMVRDKDLDGVIVHNRKGTVFLKTPPDDLVSNNLA